MADPFLSTGNIFDYDPLKHDTLVNQDPFQGSYSQTHRMRAFCQVIVSGVDITNKIKPHLISVSINDGNPEKACEIEIDDRDGLVPIPPLTAPVEVLIGWLSERMYKMFHGVILDFEHGFGRKQGGRRMWVHAAGTDTLSTRIKMPGRDKMGDGAEAGQKEGAKFPLTAWIHQFVGKAGGSAYVNGAFAKVQKDRWDMNGASAHHLAQSLGEDHGAMVQWGEGNKLFFEVPGERGVSCRAVWRDNLIGWRVRPFAARTNWGGFSADNYNSQQGQWEQQNQQRNAGAGPGILAKAIGSLPGPAATLTAGAASNAGATSGQEFHGSGVGRIAMIGEPAAQFDSYVELEGAREGVDGKYLINKAEHIYSRRGYVTWLDVTVDDGADARTNGGSVYHNWPLPRPGPNIL